MTISLLLVESTYLHFHIFTLCYMGVDPIVSICECDANAMIIRYAIIIRSQFHIYLPWGQHLLSIGS